MARIPHCPGVYQPPRACPGAKHPRGPTHASRRPVTAAPRAPRAGPRTVQGGPPGGLPGCPGPERARRSRSRLPSPRGAGRRWRGAAIPRPSASPSRRPGGISTAAIGRSSAVRLNLTKGNSSFQRSSFRYDLRSPSPIGGAMWSQTNAPTAGSKTTVTGTSKRRRPSSRRSHELIPSRSIRSTGPSRSSASQASTVGASGPAGPFSRPSTRAERPRSALPRSPRPPRDRRPWPGPPGHPAGCVRDPRGAGR